MNELFTVPPSLSPRLKWMQRHGITVRETGDDAQPWIAEQASSMRYAYGESEVDALGNLGRKLGLNHWSLI